LIYFRAITKTLFSILLILGVVIGRHSNYLKHEIIRQRQTKHKFPTEDSEDFVNSSKKIRLTDSNMNSPSISVDNSSPLTNLNEKNFSDSVLNFDQDWLNTNETFFNFEDYNKDNQYSQDFFSVQCLEVNSRSEINYVMQDNFDPFQFSALYY
jgi:hypothetical protein